MMYAAGWPLLAPAVPLVSMQVRRIIYRGGHVALHVLVQELEERGMRVLWQPPDQGWNGGLYSGTRQHVVEILADGSLVDIGAAIEQMRRRDPRAEAEVHESDAGGE